MKRKILSLILTLSLALGVLASPVALAAEAAVPDRPVPYIEGVAQLVDAMGWSLKEQALDFELDTVCLTTSVYRPDNVYTVTTTPTSRQQPMTLRDLLDVHITLSHHSSDTPQLVYVEDGAITSPLLGTSFLSADEAAALTAKLDQPLTADTAALLCNRIRCCYGLLDAPDSAQLFESLLPEYAPVLQNVGTDVLGYWVGDTWTRGVWTAAAHEMTHEYVARADGTYSGREKFSGDDAEWFGEVYWSQTPKTYYTGTGLIKATALPLPPMSIIPVPADEAQEIIYTQYLADNKGYTIYEALQEFTATAPQLVGEIRLGALNGSGSYDARNRYTAWSYYIQTYFLTLRETRPDLWRQLLADGTIPRVFCETDRLAQSCIILERSRFSTTSELTDKMLSTLATAPYADMRAELASC